MKIGVAYYPEHWPEDRWATDAELMADMGVEVVRVGEFSWARLEPRRERYELDWLEKAIEALAARGLEVILCTPTAAPPAWLFGRHPSIVPQTSDGRAWQPGSRRHVCLSNPAYVKYARRITTELARRFGENRHVIAWQLDNELGAGPSGVCYCSECEQAFRWWLKRRYGTVDRLNRMWGTAFWSQGFGDWHEIPAPRRTPGGPHPSLALDYKRFVSAQHRSFVEQLREAIIEEAGTEPLVTVNEPGGMWVPHINMFALASEQGVVSLDNYPADASRLDMVALDLNLARSLKHKPFWVMEQQAGAALVPGHQQQPRPGQLRLWSFQAAARGAELISYFPWRTTPFGQEMHWGGILEAGGNPSRRCEELRKTFAELKQHAGLWEGRLPAAEVAIVLDYDSAWALESTVMGQRSGALNQVRTFHAALRRMGVGVEFVAPEDDLTAFRVVVVPMPFACTEREAKQLEAFAQGGGRVLVSAPAGYKTSANTSLDAPPGLLSALLGVEIEEHDILGGGMQNSVRMDTGEEFPVASLCSMIALRGAQAIGTYTAQFYAGSPAVTRNAVGQGAAVFVGADCGAECLDAVLRRTLEEAGVRVSGWASEHVEVIPLRSAGEGPERIFVLNHAGEPTELPVPPDCVAKDLLTERECSGVLLLEPYGVTLIELHKLGAP